MLIGNNISISQQNKHKFSVIVKKKLIVRILQNELNIFTIFYNLLNMSVSEIKLVNYINL